MPRTRTPADGGEGSRGLGSKIIDRFRLLKATRQPSQPSQTEPRRVSCYTKLNEDVILNIVDQLDPACRCDRYALYTCLFTSRWFFAQAARRLWSTVRLRTAISGPIGVINPSNLLLQYAVVHDTPSATEATGEGGTSLEDAVPKFEYLRRVFDSDTAPSVFSTASKTRDARFKIYFGAVRHLVCNGGPWTVPLDRVLPLVGGSVDIVDARTADQHHLRLLEAWAVLGRGGRGGVGGPGHVWLGASVTGRSTTLVDDDTTRAIDFSSHTNTEDGDLAALIGSVVVGPQITSLGFRVVMGAVDLAAVRGLLERGNNVIIRRLDVAFAEIPAGLPLPSSSSSSSSAPLLAVNGLTRLSCIYRKCGEHHLLSELLTASQDTLVDFSLKLLRCSGEPARIGPLPRLESLQLEVRSNGTTAAGGLCGMTEMLRSMTSLRRLDVTFHDTPTLNDVLEGLAGLQSLKELTLSLKMNVWTSSSRMTRKTGIRLSGLRKLTVLGLELYHNPTLPVADWSEVERCGLPLLEELDLDLDDVTLCGDGVRPSRLKAIVLDAILDAGKTPVLTLARIQSLKDSAKPLFSCTSSRFSPEVQGRLRAMKKRKIKKKRRL
ncbi:hypothetical protein HK101_006849 [Irineochytrium annulatum]|nr:hypothetical protein HK101_006849 [Irineochytrium annulatum]